MMGRARETGARAAGSANALVRQATRTLASAGITHARAEAEWLLSHLAGGRPLDLYLDDSPVTSGTRKRFIRQVAARAAGTPLQYVLGDTEFFGQRIIVGPGVFIPRPETEVIVDAFLSALRSREHSAGRPLHLVDLGTGSGCIALALARAFPACVVVGVELSWVALCAARRNARRLQRPTRLSIIQGRWLAPIRGMVDGIISNPPYLPSAQVAHLPLEVRREPRLSLDGGVDGMREILEILADLPRVLRPGGVAAFECGEDQVDRLAQRLASASWIERVTRVDDLALRPRGIVIRARER